MAFGIYSPELAPKGLKFQETHESILELLPANLANSVEAIPGFQGSRNISPLEPLWKKC
jgi:hypothetical protein